MAHNNDLINGRHCVFNLIYQLTSFHLPKNKIKDLLHRRTDSSSSIYFQNLTTGEGVAGRDPPLNPKHPERQTIGLSMRTFVDGEEVGGVELLLVGVVRRDVSRPGIIFKGSGHTAE